MLRVNAFRALRPPAALAEQVASVPYDVVNKAEARALAAGNSSPSRDVLAPPPLSYFSQKCGFL